MADMINEQGGIKIGSDTYMIELLNEDTKSTMDGVTAAANRLVFEKDIKFIIGPTAFFSAAASPVCDPNKVMRVLSWCDGTPGQMDASTPYSFLGTPSSQGCAAVTAKYLHEAYPNVKKVAVVSPDDGNFPHLKRMFDPLIAEVGIEMVGDPVLYPNEMQDFSPIAQKVNAMKDSIDAVYHVNGVGPHTGNIAKGLRELGFTKPYACSLPSPLTEVITIAGLEASKDVFTISYTATDTSFPPLVKELVDRTVAEYGQDYSLYFTGADSLWALKEVIQAAQSLDPTEVKEQWESMDTIETLWGPGTVCGDEHSVSRTTCAPCQFRY